MTASEPATSAVTCPAGITSSAELEMFTPSRCKVTVHTTSTALTVPEMAPDTLNRLPVVSDIDGAAKFAAATPVNAAPLTVEDSLSATVVPLAPWA